MYLRKRLHDRGTFFALLLLSLSHDYGSTHVALRFLRVGPFLHHLNNQYINNISSHGIGHSNNKLTPYRENVKIALSTLRMIINIWF